MHLRAAFAGQAETQSDVETGPVSRQWNDAHGAAHVIRILRVGGLVDRDPVFNSPLYGKIELQVLAQRHGALSLIKEAVFRQTLYSDYARHVPGKQPDVVCMRLHPLVGNIDLVLDLRAGIDREQAGQQAGRRQ